MKSSARRVHRAIGALVATCAMLGASACGGGGDEGGTTEGIEFVSEGELTVCTHLPYKPFEFRGDNGEVVGFDVSMLELLAEDLGLEMSIVDIAWSQITSGAAFAADKCDLGMGAMTITDERDKALLISDPYFDATQALLVQKDSGYSGLEDLEGKKLGVQTDTTGQFYAEEHAEEFGYEIVVFDDSLTEFNGVKTGKVDAAINDNGAMYDFVQANSELEVAAEFDTGEHYGFAAQKDDENAQKLVDRLNDVIAQAKKDGTYDKIFKEWFGALPKKATDG